jgi:hypothetical protein
MMADVERSFSHRIWMISRSAAGWAVDVADAQEVQHDFLAVDIDIADLDAALQQNHDAVTGFSAPADDVAPGEFFGVAAFDQGIECGIGKPTEERVVPEKRTDTIDK